MLGEFAATSAAVDHFAARLSLETDPSDVHAALESGHAFVLVDSRGETSRRQGRIAGAIHMPTSQIASRAASEIPEGTEIVTYCWGQGCGTYPPLSRPAHRSRAGRDPICAQW